MSLDGIGKVSQLQSLSPFSSPTLRDVKMGGSSPPCYSVGKGMSVQETETNQMIQSRN